MNKKLERELNGPTWTEVILGALLSLLLGIALAAVYLALKPVTTVKALPQEPAPGVVYYIEGSRNSVSLSALAAKQKTFIEGGSIELTEDEVNQFVGAAAKTAAAADAAQNVGAGVPNFRIRDGVMQIGIPLQLDLAGFAPRVILQARGGFEKRGDVFVFSPSELYLGSCPLQRVPAATGLVMKRIYGSLNVPEEIATSWRQLSDVSVEGSKLRLTM